MNIKHVWHVGSAPTWLAGNNPIDKPAQFELKSQKPEIRINISQREVVLGGVTTGEEVKINQRQEVQLSAESW